VGDSIAVNGTCLTATSLTADSFTADVMIQTLSLTSLGKLAVGSPVNLELAARMDMRMGGHIVQGHVDQIGTCITVQEANGSWYYTFEYDATLNNLTIEKGSITVNGVSLTVVNSKKAEFSVAIIPYTYEHTNFHNFQVGTKVNLEFDVIGKYVAKLYSQKE
jgi:riboflavin synthase